MRAVIITLVFFLIPIAGLTHGTPFFEFNPDSYATSALNVSSFQTPAEVFIPQNDFLNGFDFWIANPSSSGPAVFQLLDENSQIISSKAVTIPIMGEIDGGTRFHVDLSSQVPVVNNKKYTLKVISSLPTLKLYYSNRIKFLPHNAPYVSEYFQGVALLGNEIKDFSFKFALYEGQEPKVPVISNVSAAAINSGQVKINFNASEPVDYKINYQAQGQTQTQTTNFTGSYEFCTQGVNICSLVVDVVQNQTYDYTLTVKDEWGNQSQFVGVFASVFSLNITPSPTSAISASATPTAEPNADTTPPVISNLRAVSINPNSADFAWDTDEAADSFLLISYSVNLITIAAANDITQELAHYLQTGPTLNPNTIYFATITSHDLANNTASATLSFTTPKLSANVTPSPLPPATPFPSVSGQPAVTSNVEALPPLNVSSTGNPNSISVAWNPPSGGEPADGYRIDIFSQKGTPEHKILASPGTHKTIIDNVVDGVHNIIVYANNSGVNEKIAKPGQVVIGKKSTLERIISSIPYLVGGLAIIIFLTALILKFLKKRKAALPPPISISKP